MKNTVPPFEPSYTVDEFCIAERTSRVSLYEEWKSNGGPRFYWKGNRRIIPHSARLEYQQRKMAEAEAHRADGEA
jgi:hypothetical protein